MFFIYNKVMQILRHFTVTLDMLSIMFCFVNKLYFNRFNSELNWYAECI